MLKKVPKILESSLSVHSFEVSLIHWR